MAVQSWSTRDLLPAHIARLKPYRSARSEGFAAHLLLDANESPWSGHDLPGGADDHRYPDPQPPALVQKLAAFYGVAPPNLLLTRGIDEGLDTLLRTYCMPGQDEIVIHPPTYGYYEVCAAIQGIKVRRAPLEAGSFQLIPGRIAEAITPATKVVILCNPNNPTGNLLDRSAIETLAGATAGRCLLLIDEAYIEFAPSFSCVDLLATYPQLVVMRTLSKAWGLAGVRMGVTLAHSETIEAMRGVLAPYPLSRPSVRAVEAAFAEGGVARLDARVASLNQLRDDWKKALEHVPGVIAVLPSAANFLMVQVKDPQSVVQKLRDRGLSIRDRSGDVAGCIRISIGTSLEKAELLSQLTEVLQ